MLRDAYDQFIHNYVIHMTLCSRYNMKFSTIMYSGTTVALLPTDFGDMSLFRGNVVLVKVYRVTKCKFTFLFPVYHLLNMWLIN